MLISQVIDAAQGRPGMGFPQPRGGRSGRPPLGCSSTTWEISIGSPWSRLRRHLSSISAPLGYCHPATVINQGALGQVRIDFC